ncbi:copper homeostasis protein [Neorhizobium galegae]|uniref:copper homeostasis protein CutC n=1 Tax=Neorhizobium galegae TaxID=399 RepID=UPI001AE89E8A|nr:copper homeostasis protein [Neorhizobium galegae]
MQPILEICVDNAAGLFAALDGGAGRIELCSALSVGGLTPSRGFMDLAGCQDVAVTAMIRPRAGNFIFSAAEIAIMKADIDAARAAGLTGVVLGASRTNGRLDTRTLRELCRHAEGLDLTLHRAFDLTPDKPQALEEAIGLGFSRILTSGGRQTALEGIDMLAALMAQAGDRITIMPGSGVRPQTAGLLLERMDITELHASCSARFIEGDSPLVDLSFAAREMLQTDTATVRALRAMLFDAAAARRLGARATA